jgi:hypothetical protein
MKFLKNMEQYLAERKMLNEDNTTDGDISNFSSEYTRKVAKIINTKEQIIETTRVTKSDPSTLSQRGAELINQAVMKKGENPDSLDINIDSEKLEYAWRMISKDVDGALEAKKIEKNGKVVASNIRLDKDNNVIFDFTFENKDSTQNTDPSGKTTKSILAGKYIKGDISVERFEEPQVQIVLGKMKAPIILNRIADKKELFNQKFKLIEAGYTQIDGTYNFQLKTKYEWVSYKSGDNTKIVEFFKNNKDSRFDVFALYQKFGIDSTTKQSTGNPDWNLQIK